MALTQLLPPNLRRRLRRLQQDVTDVTTALTVPLRPPARSGALSDPDVYAAAPEEIPRPASQTEPLDSLDSLESLESLESFDSFDSIDQQATRVLFLDHDTELVVRPGQTILKAGLEAGLDLDFSCTVGGCAACALQIVEGEVVYDGPNCLTEAERQSGMCLACVGRPSGRLVVETL